MVEEADCSIMIISHTLPLFVPLVLNGFSVSSVEESVINR